jgi:gamma-glutamyltranspeptidase/glutathione hydrolase
MVASSQRLASETGVAILRRGGNAADAAVAMAAALAVTEPCSTGLGGDAFALYYRNGFVTALNGSGRAPADVGELSPDPFHADKVTVPGACAAWHDLSERFGTLTMRDLVAPAIRLAADGFAVAPITRHFWLKGLSRVRGGELALPGERFRNPGMVRSLEAVAAGRDAFYRGPVAHAIVQAVRREGGRLSLDDLAEHRSTWDEPISTTFCGHRVWECPPNGQGIVALLALNIYEGLRGWHAMIESIRLAFADARAHVADGACCARLLSKEYATTRRAKIDPARAMGEPAAGSASDTVYFCVVDGRGEACSFINSNYMGFGTGIVPEEWGFTLQNRGANFSREPGHPNAPAPRKRPYHTIMPGMITRNDGSLYGPFGVMGGFMQPQGHLQVAVALLEDGATPQEALDRPRFCVESDGRVHLEEGAPAEELARLGHRVVANVSGFDRALFGRGQVIVRHPDGRLEGGSDRRADGCALAEQGDGS